MGGGRPPGAGLPGGGGAAPLAGLPGTEGAGRPGGVAWGVVVPPEGAGGGGRAVCGGAWGTPELQG